MNKGNWIELIIIILLTIGLCISVYSCSKRDEGKVEIVYVEKKDSTSVPKQRIKEKQKTVVVTKIDTFYVVVDSSRLHQYDSAMADVVNLIDTIKLADLPIEYKNYRDTIKKDSSSTIIDISYHGFAAEIDSLSLVHSYYNKYTTIKKRNRYGWGFYIGPSVGYGINFRNNEIYSAPYVGVCIGFGWGIMLKK
jgi:hypothetical protein